MNCFNRLITHLAILLLANPLHAADLSLSALPADGSITLNWTTVAGAKAYSLCAASEPILDIDQCTAYQGGIWLDLTANRLTLNNLANGMEYSYRLLAFNTRDILAVSNAVTVKPGVVVQVPVATGHFNDTGIINRQCYQAGSNDLVDCTSAKAMALNSLQDGMTGRDANPATNGQEDGAKGFSYSKIDITGQTLPGYASDWSCVRDNVTGLIWEVKTSEGLRSGANLYTNWGDPKNKADTGGYVVAVNAQGLCGASDWRLPTVDELQTLVDYGMAFPGPTLDTSYFPNTAGSAFWTSTPYAGLTNLAWYLSFGGGNVSSSNRSSTFPIRLVRVGQ